MKIAFFDVSNGSCAIAVCKYGHSIMFDCGSNSDKDCPVDIIHNLKKPTGWLSHMTNYQDNIGQTYPLTMLVVSHPDLDHIKNIDKVHTKLTPYLLDRNKIVEFPHSVVHQDDEKYLYYRDNVCSRYIHEATQLPNWAFTHKKFFIPLNTLIKEPQFGESKIKNNSSIIYLLQYGSFRILFCGDMETVGWDWLIDNNYQGFSDEMKNGIDVLVASHHGHVSGYSQKLMNLIKAPKLSILSKGSEEGSETDVDSRYSANSTGLLVYGLNPSTPTRKYTLTTRTNGNIFIEVDDAGNPKVIAEKI